MLWVRPPPSLLMFNLGYNKIRNKGRRGNRGPKQRYAVFRAERNVTQEEHWEWHCKKWCDEKGVNLDEFKVDTKQPWRNTWEALMIHAHSRPYSWAKIYHRRNPGLRTIMRQNKNIYKRWRKDGKRERE